MNRKPEIPACAGAVFDRAGYIEAYPPPMLGPSTLGATALDAATLDLALEVLGRLEPDDYIRFLLAFCAEARGRYGAHWHYADITTACLAAARLLQPSSYLEIGVRRGRSMAMVAAACPNCRLLGFDLWIENYAGMPNPGPDFVRQQMREVGHRGLLDLVGGDSHVTLKAYLHDHPGEYFDLVTVDGDHSEAGAAEDLADVLPRVARGGVVVFDDIAHPAHPYLLAVFEAACAAAGDFRTWRFAEVGYGVAMAVRYA